jgi:hypothetical protein
MYRKLSETTGNLLGYAIEDRLTEDEVLRMQGELSAAMERHGSVRLLARLEGLEGVEPSAVWQDLKMTPEYVRNIERMAVVGEARWQEWSTKLAGAFTEARHFAPDELDQAWAWLRQDDSERSSR